MQKKGEVYLMMKRMLCILLACLLCLGTAAMAEESLVPDISLDAMPVPETAAQAFVEDMRLGINLGNGFDAHECGWLTNELDYESAWCHAKVSETLLDVLKEAGFNTIRLPVSWHNHVDAGYTISKPWLDRVQQVVDWALARDFYVIVNIHHDNNAEFLYPDSKHMEQSTAFITAIWQQLAERFADYGEHLLFESMNEPRLVGHRNEWWIDANNADCKDAIRCINELNQIFVDTVRASGSVNATRYLVVPGYDASPDGVLNAGFVIPTDPNPDNDTRILLGVHAYTPYNFALDYPGTAKWSVTNSMNRAEVTGFMDNLYNRYVSKGQPVLLTEFGARDKQGNLAARTQFAAFYVAAARARGMSCVWWDNNIPAGDGERFGIIDRQTAEWIYPSIVEAMVRYAAK